MGIVHEQHDESISIGLEGSVDITCAAELKGALVLALSSGKPVHLTLDRCSVFDVTAFQLLSAAQREAKSLGVEFALASPVPAPILAALKEVGFDSFPVPA